MKELNLLWVDQEHPEVWSPHFQALEEVYGFKIELITSIEDQNVLDSCEQKNAVIIHCGTKRPMFGIKDLLIDIKTKYPNIKIGMQTDAKHPSIENLVDFYVHMPIGPDELQENLRHDIE